MVGLYLQIQKQFYLPKKLKSKVNDNNQSPHDIFGKNIGKEKLPEKVIVKFIYS